MKKKHTVTRDPEGLKSWLMDANRDVVLEIGSSKAELATGLVRTMLFCMFGSSQISPELLNAWVTCFSRIGNFVTQKIHGTPEQVQQKHSSDITRYVNVLKHTIEELLQRTSEELGEAS